MSKDPTGITSSTNIYYLGENAVCWFDPYGLAPVSLHDIVTHGTNQSGLEMHHGILDVWATHNIPDYVSRATRNPSIALTQAEHSATTSAFRDWLEEKTGKRVGGAIDWKKVSKEEVEKLSERMFDAAKAPKEAMARYYSAFADYVKKGCKR